MQSETGFPSSRQLKSYVASKSRLKLAARAVLSADAGLLVQTAVEKTDTEVPSAGPRPSRVTRRSTFQSMLLMMPSRTLLDYSLTKQWRIDGGGLLGSQRTQPRSYVPPITV